MTAAPIYLPTPRRDDAVHSGVGDELTSVLVVVSESPQQHSLYGAETPSTGTSFEGWRLIQIPFEGPLHGLPEVLV